MRLGDRLREVIDDSDYSIEQVARRARIARSQINKILSGKTKSPGIRNFAKIARALDVTVDYLLIGVDDVEGPDDLSVQDLGRLLVTLGRSRGKSDADLLALMEQLEQGTNAARDGSHPGPVAQGEADDKPEQPGDQ